MNSIEARTDLKARDLTELAALVAELGWEPYRARQLFTWLWQKGATEFEVMTNLARAKREQLKARARVSALAELGRTQAPDGTTKFRFGLEDGLRVETVFIPEPPRKTVCVSTQVGCPLGCAICFTGKSGFRRNLKFHEIADQVLQVGSRIAAVGPGGRGVRQRGARGDAVEDLRHGALAGR
ncbi:MAG: hypothetical protein ABIK62_07845, partial [candidate division WOR-3 bacterium]